MWKSQFTDYLLVRDVISLIKKINSAPCVKWMIQVPSSIFVYMSVLWNRLESSIKTYYTRRPNVFKMKQLAFYFYIRTYLRVLKKLSRFCQIIMARFWCLVIAVLLHCMYCKILLPLFAIKGEVQLWKGGRF